MAGQKPGLVTGSNAKLKFGNKTLAYASDVSYSVDVSVVPVEVMGRYEVITNEPIATNVRGSFTIVRYTKEGNAGLYGSSKTSGNGVGALGKDGTTANSGQANAFNPGQMLSTSTVDLEIFQRSSAGGNIGDSLKLVKIQDCRLTRLSSGLSKRGIMTETYDFVGVLYGDESFNASLSGSGEDLT
jgi:hypothetical protein